MDTQEWNRGALVKDGDALVLVRPDGSELHIPLGPLFDNVHEALQDQADLLREDGDLPSLCPVGDELAEVAEWITVGNSPQEETTGPYGPGPAMGKGHPHQHTKGYRPHQHCEAIARKGTGTGTCNRTLDDRGQCDRPSDHLEG